jgi:hypothetical protein
MKFPSANEQMCTLVDAMGDACIDLWHSSAPQFSKATWTSAQVDKVYSIANSGCSCI